MTTEEARLQSRDVWDRMAAGWTKHRDYLWSITRQVGEWLVDHLDPQPGQTILEVAAGPGDTGFVAAQLLGSEGKLISTDFAEKMVDVARARAQSLDITNVEFMVMDAEHMDLPDDHVDGVLCRWGFMLMLDPAAAMRETRRVLRPGGKLAFSVWGAPMDNPWVTLIGMVLTQRGTPPQGDPFGPGGIFSLSEHDRIRELLTDAGFDGIEIEDMAVSWDHSDFDSLWSYISEMSGVISTVIAELDDDEVASLRADIKAAAESFRSGDGYAFPGKTINVLAQ